LIKVKAGAATGYGKMLLVFKGITLVLADLFEVPNNKYTKNNFQ